ncbi:MAG TPA: arsenic transporter [Lachnoclostridium phytofermentans]|uniref:Arsenic transporter n=1 Tax=Lachnoclostridium phytofermentans TaxID=66219 RepID=A0A3D2X9Y4_9FIRM|nr:SLC13 family permease [Lachnoclostridium sp.]HCL03960.1 arsenic transporter [Lachnoclostridium phytofermentans]
MLITALILFIITYVLMLSLSKYRYLVAITSAFLFVVIGILPVTKVFPSVDFNVILMIAGTMGTVSLFIESKMPSLLSDLLIRKATNVCSAVVVLSLFAGVISAFVDNVATVLMVAPVGLAIAKKVKISPVPVLISIAVSSNLQGAATLVGDTTSILLGNYANMDFLDFFFMNGKPGIFWAVELGAVATLLVLSMIFRKEKQPITVVEMTKVTDFIPTILLCGTVVSLILASFIPHKPAITNGIICVGFFLVGIIWSIIKNGNFSSAIKALKEIDYQTLLLLAGLFVVIAGITEAGVINKISEYFVLIAGDNVFIVYTLLVFASVIFSAFIDNIPYVATMLPVVSSIATMMNVEPYLLYFGLLIGATLGGNLTPIGASANITAIGILRKDGYEVKTKDFMRIGVPFTLMAVWIGYVFIWAVYH